MTRHSLLRHRLRTGLMLAVGATLACAAAVPAQQTVNVAVIDVGRILEESELGKAALQELKTLTEQKNAEAAGLQGEAKSLQDQITAGRLSLAEDRLEELRAELERKLIALKRLEDDANRELAKQRDRKLGAIEQKIMPVINQVGAEFGYTLIFNKFQSGLVFARQEIDITDLILERFNAATAQGN